MIIQVTIVLAMCAIGTYEMCTFSEGSGPCSKMGNDLFNASQYSRDTSMINDELCTLYSDLYYCLKDTGCTNAEAGSVSLTECSGTLCDDCSKGGALRSSGPFVFIATFMGYINIRLG